MEDEPVLLDERRGTEARKAREMRRLGAEVEAERAALRLPQAELERHFLAGRLAGGGVPA